MNKDHFAINIGKCWPPRVVRVARRGPEFMSGMKMLFVTDIHIRGTVGVQAHIERLLALIDSLGADLILWGGDYAEGRWHGELLRGMGALRPRLGMFGVLGNNDQRAYTRRPRVFTDAQDHFTLLVNGAARVPVQGGCIRVIGVDDPRMGAPDLKLLDQPREAREYRILLSHSPTALNDMPDAPSAWPDLVLCGHTHGGQLNLFGLNPYTFGYDDGRRLRHFYVTGQHEINGSLLIVSNGLGTSVIPLRVGAPPELHLINFTSGNGPETGDNWAKLT